MKYKIYLEKLQKELKKNVKELKSFPGMSLERSRIIMNIGESDYWIQEELKNT